MMHKKNHKKPTTLIEEIEAQLDSTLQKNREELESSLEEKILKEREETQRKIDEMEKELSEKREMLESYKSALLDFEIRKNGIRQQIQDCVEGAISFQREIEEKVLLTLDELTKVEGLKKQFEEINKEAQQNISDMQSELEKRYGIKAETQYIDEKSEIPIQIEKERSKLNKIKKLLAKEHLAEKAQGEIEPPHPDMDLNSTESKQSEEAITIPKQEEADVEPKKLKETEGEQNERKESDSGILDFLSKEENEPFPPEKEEDDKPWSEIAPWNQVRNEKGLLSREILEQYRRSEESESDGEVFCFENKDKMILDAESFFAFVEKKLEEIQKLFTDLSGIDSPKDQFFIKQEIIKHQEMVRKLLLNTIGMSDKRPEFFPDFVKDILNTSTLKDILEKVTIENWSNEEDFASSHAYLGKLKESFYEKITPPDQYFESLLRTLEGEKTSE